MKIKSLKTFVYLVENDCNFQAGKLIGLPRSTMWSHIDELEKELGVSLIQRQKQNCHFTKEGLAFIPFAQQILIELQKATEAMHDENIDTHRGKIRIATTKAVSNSWIAPSMRDFYHTHPGLRLSILADDRHTKSITNNADILIRPLITIPDDFEQRWNITYTSGLYASPQYLKEKGVPQTPEDLKHHNIIAYGEEEFHGFEDINWHIKGKGYGLPRLQPMLTINSTAAIYSAAVEGIGICTATNLSNPIYSQLLVPVLPEIKGPTVSTYCCLRKTLNQITRNNLMIFEKFFVKYLNKRGIEINVVAE